MDTLGRNIKKLRLGKGWTLKDLSEKLQVSLKLISAYESGRITPPLNNLLKYSEIFSISIDELVSEDFISTHNSPLSRNKNYLIPIHAEAGYLSSANMNVENNQLIEIVIPGILGEARTFQVSGDSMEPILFSGDYVSGTKITDPRDISPFNISIFVTRSGVFIKYGLLGLGQITLLSANKDYTDFTIQTDEIIEVWKASARITTRLNHIQEANDKLTNVVEFLTSNFPNFNT